MRTRTERTVLTAIAVVLVAAAAAAWWTRDQWLPHAGPWTGQAWKKITRPGPDTLPPGKQPAQPAGTAQGGASQPMAAQPRKCVQDGRTTYTEQPCPKGRRSCRWTAPSHRSPARNIDTARIYLNRSR